MKSSRSNKKKIDSIEQSSIYSSSSSSSSPSVLPATSTTVLDENPITLNFNKNSEDHGTKCGEIFYSKNNEDFNYLCTICNILFQGVEKFITHINRNHNEIRSNPIDCNENSNNSFDQINEFSNQTQQLGIKIIPEIHKKQINPIDNDENVLNKEIKNEIENDIEFDESDNENLMNKKKRKNNKPGVSCKLCHLKFTSNIFLKNHLNFDHADPNPFKLNTEPDEWSEDDEDDDNDDIKDNLKNSDNKILRNQTKINNNYFRQIIEKLDKSIEKDPLKCRYCGKRCRSRMERFEHECLHTGEKSFKCDECGKTFRTKASLNEHVRIHKDKRQFNCEICNSILKSKRYLKIHMRIHNGIKPFKCRYCEKTFTHCGGKRSHERTHTNEKPYQCTECGLRFRTSGIYSKHMKCHGGVKLYVCSYCGKSYVDIHGLNRHEKIHVAKGAHACKICNSRFKTHIGLGVHMKGHSKNMSDKDTNKIIKSEITIDTIDNDFVGTSSIPSNQSIEIAENDKNTTLSLTSSS